jgi:GTP-binding protein
LPDFRSFVVADVPGLIEGAHRGHGLGDRFLKHIERTRVLVHMVDITSNGRDPLEDYRVIMRELPLFNEDLGRRKQIVVASKLDAMDDPTRLSRLKTSCRRRRIPFHAISAVTGEGIPELIHLLERSLGL